jgi:hypothetical protein
MVNTLPFVTTNLSLALLTVEDRGVSVFISFGRAKGSMSRVRFPAGTRDISLLHIVKTALVPTEPHVGGYRRLFSEG